MKAIISDVHGNLEALQAVLQDIEEHQVNEIICLGDIIGYGPDPQQCLDLAMQWNLVLLGNHDHAVLFEPKDFNPMAHQATLWTRSQLETPSADREADERRWEFLCQLQSKHAEQDTLYVHASPRQPLNEYVFPTDTFDKRKMNQMFSRFGKVCFHGHTHLPGIFTPEHMFFSPQEIDCIYEFDDGKVMCNVGSVGQPRDGDWRACYVLVDESRIEFRRVEYAVQKTVEKIYRAGELDIYLGERLLVGR